MAGSFEHSIEPSGYMRVGVDALIM